MSKKAVFIVMCSVLLFSWAAFADGDTRKSTQAEKDYSANVLTHLDKAVPVMPQNWSQGNRTAVKAFESVVPDCEKYPLSVSYEVSWEDSKKLDEAQQKMGTAMESLAKSDAFSMKGTEELTKKTEALAKQASEAAMKGNMAEVERIQKEIQVIADAFAAKGGEQEKLVKGATDPLKAKDAKIKIRFQVNEREDDLTESVKEPSVQNAPTFRREADEDEGETTVFLGPWKLEEAEGVKTMKPEFNASLPHTTCQNIKITVRAEKNRAAEVLKSLNWASIQELLKK